MPWKADFTVQSDFSTDIEKQQPTMPNVLVMENRPTTETGSVIDEGWKESTMWKNRGWKRPESESV